MNKNSKKSTLEIHCPVPGCLFAEGSERHFTAKKFLNQHIAKVHAEKKYACSKCQKSFGLDWWRKHHEKTCGMIWRCDCGVQYSARESLLTHIRRTQHKLPDCLISSDNMKQKSSIKPSDNPVIVLIQPIIQNINCIQPFQTSVATPRRILPKTTPPILLTLPIPVGVTTPAPMPNSISSMIPEQTKENLSYNSVSSSSRSMLPTPSNQHYSNTNSALDNSEKNTGYQKTVATQTVEDSGDICTKRRQSQASQCSRRRPKSLKIGIENHTQTAESAVTKIKKRRSRRKSVAITTDTSVVTDQTLGNNSFWPGFKDFVLQHADSLGTRLFKNSTSTQTHMINNKILCDSETLTDNDLINFPWEDAMKLVDKNEKCEAEFQLINNINHLETNALQADIDNNNIQDLNIFSGSALNKFSEIKSSPERNQCNIIPPSASLSNPFTTISDCESNTLQHTSDEKCSVFSVFGNGEKTVTANVPHAPTLSDIHTQTMASAILDYNLLTNMETQTTDDFNFSYLDFSDTETQTPWDDFPIEKDQLSIEIQTDFSSFAAGLNLDPYELINSVDVQSIIAGCSSKETAGVNTETQTLDKFYFPQLTNSESQTLDVSNFIFDS